MFGNWLSRRESGPHAIAKFDVRALGPARRYFRRHGYVVFKNAFDLAQGEAFWADLERALGENVPLTFSHFGKLHVNPDVPLEGFKLPRIIDAEHFLASARALALAPIVMAFLKKYYGRWPTCLQTLTYKFSSEQGAHSDRSLVAPPHSPDYDRDTLAACWFALEDADARNGALVIYPGSHRVPTRAISDGFGTSYRDFSDHCAEASEAAGCLPVTFEAKAGDVLFWHGNLVHAGGRILDRDGRPTRRSFVCHYAAMPGKARSAHPDWRRERHGKGWYFARA